MLADVDKWKPAILRTLIYYDIFRYPLSEEDIIQNCRMMAANREGCKKALDELAAEQVIYKLGDFYSLTNNPEQVSNRLSGNKKAKLWMKRALRFSRLISKFPFVRGVSLSGSLSKGYLGDDPDIDYFIITKPGRLWVARSFLVIFKKIFLLNSYKYFCINYFIDSENMEIEEKNIFTATEVITMIPVYGSAIKELFFERNQWVKKFYPRFEIQDLDQIPERRGGVFKRSLEFILNGSLGERLDNYFMNKTLNHWKNKFRKGFSEEEFQLVFKSTKSVSKHHPSNFQKRVLQAFEAKKKEIEEKFDIKISTQDQFVGAEA